MRRHCCCAHNGPNCALTSPSSSRPSRSPSWPKAAPSPAGTPLTAILGISAFYHDSAAALCVDGVVVAAAQEERFTRRKHDQSFPSHAVAYCMLEAKLVPEQIDYVAY